MSDTRRCEICNKVIPIANINIAIKSAPNIEYLVAFQYGHTHSKLICLDCVKGAGAMKVDVSRIGV